MEVLQDLAQEYDARFGPIATYRNAVWKTLIAGFFQRYVPETAAVLDLGCGWGDFIRNVRARERFAMDLNPHAPSRVGPDVETLLQDCAKPWPLVSNSLDVVFSSNFFEHLPTKDSLRSTLRETWRCLRPGGRLIALGPNIRYLPGAYSVIAHGACVQ